jgi:hypothetical protein
VPAVNTCDSDFKACVAKNGQLPLPPKGPTKETDPGAWAQYQVEVAAWGEHAAAWVAGYQKCVAQYVSCVAKRVKHQIE